MLKLPSPWNERLLRHEPLARYTAARLGGPADFLYVVKGSLDELVEVVTSAWGQRIPVRILGGGANVLVSDKRVRGLVVINDVSEVRFGEWQGGRNVAATSGTGLTVLARKCQARGLSGLEWAVGVPGTVGGAVVNNAGAHGGDIAGTLCEAVIFDAQYGAQIITLEELAYGYRTSSLKARRNPYFLVLMAQFSLQPASPESIRTQMEHFISYRKQTQPPGASLGSIFKNPAADYAGRLIEAAGLKGYQIGGAQISPVHANFFINVGNATSSNYHGLIQHAQESVRKQFGIELELEIELVGVW
jgi:UDP-N-acetylmuramate dehydrogenase